MKKLLVLLLTTTISCSCFATPKTEAFLKAVLDNMTENRQHHIGVKLGKHKLFTNPSGGEAVYDIETGKLVADPTNMGTTNYFVYSKGAEHFSIDTYPWLLMGNKGAEWAAANIPTEGEDRSTLAQRATAWQLDFVDAVNKVCERSPALFKSTAKNLFTQNEYQRFTKDVFQPFLNNKLIIKLVTNNPCRPSTHEEQIALGVARMDVLQPENLAKAEFQNRYTKLVQLYEKK